MSRWAAVALAVAGLCAATSGVARGDGDPASDYLLTQPVFVPYNAPSPALRGELTALAKASARKGYPVRVAVIQSKRDLGAIPQLLGKPGEYARFLGAELRFAYRGRLLVVMQQGYGFTKNGNPDHQGLRTLANVPGPAGNSSDQLTQAAIVALRRVAAGAGHPLPARVAVVAPSTGGGSGSSTVEIAGGVVVVALLACGLLLFFARRSATGGTDS
ncbi:MAG TPA: hypothetical protein VFQ71_03175 [Gaiellales bacterium]|jgi:hypothetical protein|nr:hypothetical protein [Gaiellales bacterium]